MPAYRTADLHSDVAQVQHEKPDSFGSGRLIGRNLILTARHVATADGAIEPTKNGWKVRLFRDKPSGDGAWEWHDADVRWVGKGESDLALLHVRPKIGELRPRLRVRVAKINRVRDHRVRGLGFPVGSRIDDARQLMTPPGNLTDEARTTLTWGIDPSYQPQAPDDDWPGFSGAGVVLEQSDDEDTVWLYGVVQDVPTSFKRQLDVARLERALDDTDFCEALRTSEVSLEPALDPTDLELAPRSPVDSNFDVSGAALRSAHRASVRASIPVLRTGEYVERREVTDELIGRLLERRPGVMLVIALHGMPGAGKTTLAQAVVQDPSLAKRFADGIFWATLGEEPDVSRTLTVWIDALSGGGSAAADLAQQSSRLAALLSDKEVLLILDSVTELRQAEWLLRAAGPKCVSLLTTRDRRVAEDCGASPSDILHLRSMTPAQASAVLGISSLDEAQADAALKLADLVGYLPLALHVLRGQHNDGAPWGELLEDLKAHADQLFEVEELPLEDVERQARLNLVASIFLSVRKLSPRQQSMFAWLGVLRDDCDINPRVAATLWDVEEREAVGFLRRLDRMALLERYVSPSGTGYYHLHATLRAFARAQLYGSKRLVDANIGLHVENISEGQTHIDLLNRYKQQAPAAELTALKDDGYIYDNLIWHLQRSQAVTDLRALLSKDDLNGGNAWFSVRQANARLDRYIGDLKSAWRHAIDTGQNIADVVRYSLMLATAWETVPSVSYNLAHALIRKNIWDWPAMDSYLSVLPENEATAASRAAILLAAADSGCVEIDVPFLRKCANATVASREVGLRVRTAAILVRALYGADALTIVKDICGIHFARFLDNTYDLWNPQAKEVVTDQVLEKFAAEPDDHLHEAIGNFPSRAGSVPQWERLRVLVATHPNPVVRGWSQLLFMRLLLARGEIRNAIRLIRTVDDVTARVRGLALLLPIGDSPRKRSRVTTILSLANTLDSEAYRKTVNQAFHDRANYVSATFWFSDYPRIAKDWLVDLTRSLAPHLTREQSPILLKMIDRAPNADLKAKAICALNLPSDDSDQRLAVRRLVRQVQNRDEADGDAFFYLLPAMTDEERSTALRQLLDRFSSDRQPPQEAIALFAEYYGDDAHRAALMRCERFMAGGAVFFRALEEGISGIGGIGMDMTVLPSQLTTTLDVFAPHLSRATLVYAMDLLARQYHADDGLMLAAVNAYVAEERVDELAQFAEQLAVMPLRKASDSDIGQLGPALKLVLPRLSSEVRTRISSLIAAHKPHAKATMDLQSEVVNDGSRPETEVETQTVALGTRTENNEREVNPSKNETINTSASEARELQRLELQRLADSRSYYERARGLMIIAPILFPELESEAIKVAEATGILGPRLRAEFELACLRAHGTHTRVGNLLPVLLRWIEAPGTQIGSSDALAFNLALNDLINQQDCKLIWDAIAQRLPFVGRACLLGKLPSLASLIAQLEPQARSGIVDAIRDVHRWWP